MSADPAAARRSYGGCYHDPQRPLAASHNESCCARTVQILAEALHFSTRNDLASPPPRAILGVAWRERDRAVRQPRATRRG